MKAIPTPFKVLAPVAALLILLVAAALSPLTPPGKRLRAEPLDLPAESTPTTIPEPSGAAYHPARGTILLVSDEGGILELTPAGTPIGRFDLPGDLEAVAVHPQTGTVFLGLERAAAVLEYDLDARHTIRRLGLDLGRSPGFPEDHHANQEIEGLCVVRQPDGSYRLLIAWESAPARVGTLDADLSPEATEAARQARARDGRPLRQSVRVHSAFAPGPRRLSGLTYEPDLGLLLVLSAQDRTITVCDLHGKVAAIYRLSISRPEGICLLPNGDAVITQEDRDKIWFYRGLRQILPRHHQNPP